MRRRQPSPARAPLRQWPSPRPVAPAQPTLGDPRVQAALRAGDVGLRANQIIDVPDRKLAGAPVLEDLQRGREAPQPVLVVGQQVVVVRHASSTEVVGPRWRRSGCPRVADAVCARQVRSDHPPRRRVGDSQPSLCAVVLTYEEFAAKPGRCQAPEGVVATSCRRGSPTPDSGRCRRLERGGIGERQASPAALQSALLRPGETWTDVQEPELEAYTAVSRGRSIGKHPTSLTCRAGWLRSPRPTRTSTRGSFTAPPARTGDLR